MENHLVIFCKAHFWPGEPGPFFIVNDYYAFGEIVRTVLQSGSLQTDIAYEGESFLEIKLSYRLEKLSPNLIKFAKLNRYIEQRFKEILNCWVMSQMNLGQNRYQSLISFLEHYNLEKENIEERYYQYLKRLDLKSYNNAKTKTDKLEDFSEQTE